MPTFQNLRDFEPDEFQKRAINYLFEGYDVLVSAPTGAGKTYIAEVFIGKKLEEGKRSWYASPLKALSNDKYREFKALFGAENVGILTGDRKENPSAPVIVGTTEIFRNIIIDSKAQGKDADVDFLVFDEAHWIADPERGVAWEEAIIFAPRKCQILFLSATFPNVDEIAEWIKEVRGKEVKVVFTTKRPVPLKWFSIGAEIKPLFSNFRKKIIIPNRSKFSVKDSLLMLKEVGSLPAIYFFSTRRECEELVLKLASDKDFVRKFSSEGERMARRQFCERFYEEFPYIRGDEFVECFVETGVAPHHAGLLPALKLVFEEALKTGIAKAIFATKTLASGIDVPARSVVIADKYTFDGKRKRPLTPTEMLQMSGRAGRRGKDKVGFVYVSAPVSQRDAVMFGEPEPIHSSFYVTPHLVLTLAKYLEPEDALTFVRKSLLSFELAPSVEKWRRRVKKFEERKKEIERAFELIRPEGFSCTLRTRQEWEDIQRRMENLLSRYEELKRQAKMFGEVSEGRISSYPSFVVDKTGGVFVAFEKIDEERSWALGKGRRSFILYRKQIALSFPAPLTVDVVREDGYPIVKNTKKLVREIENFEDMFFPEDVRAKRKEFLQSKGYAQKSKEIFERIRDVELALERLREEAERFPCSNCPAFSDCTRVWREWKRAEDKIKKLERKDPDIVKREYENMLKFLQKLGYLDENYVLTEKGWDASCIKQPRSIYIYEYLTSFDIDDPRELSAVVCALLSDPRPPFIPSPEKIEKLVERIYNLEVGFALTPKFSPVVKRGKKVFTDGRLYDAVLLWAQGANIEEVESETEVQPGDLTRSVIQTVEVLRQIQDIWRFKDIAREAVKTIFRKPISDFVE